MPFIPDYVHLEHTTGRTFRLLEDLTYKAKNGHRTVIHAGLITDMATVPHSLWSIIAPFGQQSLPAILHDQECTTIRTRVPQRSKARLKERRTVDSRFLEALLERGVPRVRAAMMWAGASLGRYWEHGSHILRFWIFVQLALGYAAIGWGAFHLGDWTGWVALAAPALATIFWGRTSPAILLAQYSGIIVLSTGLVVFALSILEWFPNIVFGARYVPPTPKQLEIEREMFGTFRHRRPFRGVGMPLGLRRTPRQGRLAWNQWRA